MSNKKIISLSLTILFIISTLTGCNYFDSTITSTTQTEQTTVTTTAKYTVDKEDILDTSRAPVFKVYHNSASGIEVTWGHKYFGSKTIKYATYYFEFENAVGDPAYDSLSKSNKSSLRCTGPIEPGKTLMLFETIIAYGSDINKVQITEIELEYMDGTVDRFWYGWYNTAIFTDADLSWNDLKYFE